MLKHLKLQPGDNKFNWKYESFVDAMNQNIESNQQKFEKKIDKVTKKDQQHF